jgi:hypothetical protein
MKRYEMHFLYSRKSNQLIHLPFILQNLNDFTKVILIAFINDQISSIKNVINHLFLHMTLE